MKERLPNRYDPYAQFESETLPNGLTVHAAHWPDRPWEAMGFVVHSGAEQDPTQLEGLAHFVEHMVSENTFVSSKDITAFFEDCGGAVNLGGTAYSHTEYKFFVPTENETIAKAFLLFGHMLLSAKIEKLIERERQVVIGEIHRRYPFKYMHDLSVHEHKALYTGYWLERFVSPFGNKEAVERVTQYDLQTYYDKHYTPPNLSIVGIGGLGLKEVVKLLSDSPFAVTKPGERTPQPVPVADVAPPTETRYIFESSKYTKESPDVGGYLSIAKIPGNIEGEAVWILRNMLNEMLNDEVRSELAWTYSIHSYSLNYRHFYEFGISCTALATNALDEIEEVVNDVITKAKHNVDLFNNTKRRILAGIFLGDDTGAGIRDGAISDLSMHQQIFTLAEGYNKVNRVTMEDIQNLLTYLEPEQRWTRITKP